MLRWGTKWHDLVHNATMDDKMAVFGTLCHDGGLLGTIKTIALLWGP